MIFTLCITWWICLFALGRANKLDQSDIHFHFLDFLLTHFILFYLFKHLIIILPDNNKITTTATKRGTNNTTKKM